MSFDVGSLLKQVSRFVKPEAPPDTTATLGAAAALTDKNSFSSLFTYKWFDNNTNLMYLLDGNSYAVGFVLAINPLMLAGVDTETQLEAIFNAVPPDTIIQFSKLSSPNVDFFAEEWLKARTANCSNELLRQSAERRKDFISVTAAGPSMLPHTRIHPRMMHWHLSVRIPFKGDLKDTIEFNSFISQVLDVRNTMTGTLKSASMDSAVLNEEQIKFILRELLNPQMLPNDRVSTQSHGTPIAEDLVENTTRTKVLSDGRISFSDASGDEVVMTAITVDQTPKALYLPMMAKTLGNPLAWDERITCPYFAYTTIHVLHPDNAKDALSQKFGLLTKQTMSESPWFRAMMGHLYERKDRAQNLLRDTEDGHNLVRAYTGINLYTPKSEASQQTEYVKGLYRRAGFRVSEEPYISLPVFLASLPLQYTPIMDPPNKGLQRAWLMSSLNAASMLQIQGDWRGTGESKGGLLLTSRSGQLATFDLLQTSTNYNFVIVAASGSGKSFLANEIVSDFLAKGGIARLIDVGRSYSRFCEINGGENIVFSPDKPMSMNPFTGIKTQADLNDMLPMLKDLLRLMAFPLTPEEDTPAYQYQLLEKAISDAWMAKGEQCELMDVVEWLRDYNADNSNRAQDLALQLEPYSHGRYRRWFSGKRTVSFNNPLVVIELEELKQDPNLQAVVLQMVMFQTTQDMYLSDRRIPKLLAIDEAWDLMGGLKTGRFVETAFRRMRKYNGIAGVITQSFEDFEKSAAARAAIENASWQFVLYQKPESIEFAVSNKRIAADDLSVDLIKSVRSGEGFSEVFVRSEHGSGLYRFISDRHTYYTFTTKPSDTNRMTALMEQGLSIVDAIDKLAMEDYARMWG